MALIIDGQVVDVPGLGTRSWKDEPALRLKMGQDGRARRTKWVRSIIAHTSKGIPGGANNLAQHVLRGAGPRGGAEACARWWSTSTASAGAHLVVDRDGTVACLADLATECTYHAGSINDVSIGIEVYQEADGGIWGASIAAFGVLVNWLCDRFNIFRQVHWPYQNGPVPRLADGGADCVGVFGHRDQTANRGFGDPGDILLESLIKCWDFEARDFLEDEDKHVWSERQRTLNAQGESLAVDGIPGPATMAAVARRGLPR